MGLDMVFRVYNKDFSRSAIDVIQNDLSVSSETISRGAWHISKWIESNLQTHTGANEYIFEPNDVSRLLRVLHRTQEEPATTDTLLPDGGEEKYQQIDQMVTILSEALREFDFERQYLVILLSY